jgi:hypothetical protein
VARFAPWPSYSGERAPGIHWIGGWVDPRGGVYNVEKRKLLTLPGLGLRPLDRQACSQSLYRLCFPRSSTESGDIHKYSSYLIRVLMNLNPIKRRKLLAEGLLPHVNPKASCSELISLISISPTNMTEFIKNATKHFYFS